VLHIIPALVKFAFKSGVCDWLLINTRREIRRSIVRLERKTGKRLTSYSNCENIEVCVLSKFLHTAFFLCLLTFATSLHSLPFQQTSTSTSLHFALTFWNYDISIKKRKKEKGTYVSIEGKLLVVKNSLQRYTSLCWSYEPHLQFEYIFPHKIMTNFISICLRQEFIASILWTEIEQIVVSIHFHVCMHSNQKIFFSSEYRFYCAYIFVSKKQNE